LKKKGVTAVCAAISHGVLSGDALERIRKCDVLKELMITDSIPFQKNAANSKIKVISIAPLLAEAIHRIHNENSVSCLFEYTRH
jgi:ribose-phosphate pyrophosphokinase